MRLISQREYERIMAVVQRAEQTPRNTHARPPKDAVVHSAVKKAAWVRFRLVNTLTVTDVSQSVCVVDDFWGGRNPGTTVTVYNLPASVNHVFSGATGAKGLATYDDIDDKYWIVQMQCP